MRKVGMRTIILGATMEHIPRSPAKSDPVSCDDQSLLAIPFNILDLAESWHIATRLAKHGVEWQIDLADPHRPETFIVKRSGKALFRVRRSVAGLHLQFLFLSETGPPQLVRNLARLWATMIRLMQISPSILTRSDDCATQRTALPGWLTGDWPQQKPTGASHNRG